MLRIMRWRMSEDDDVEENEDEDDNAEDEVEDDKVADYKKEGDDDVEKEEVDHAPHALFEPADMSQEPFYAEIDKKNTAGQDRAARFVRACAVDMYMDMSQENAEICRQNGAPQKLGARFVRACAVEMHMDMSQSRAMSCRNLQAQARAPAVRRTFCASLRNQNAHRHVT